MGSLGRLLELVPKYWLRGLLALFSLLVGTAVSMTIPYVVKAVIDGPLVSGDLRVINRYVLIIGGVALVRGVTSLVQTYCTESLAQAVVYDLRNKLYDHLQRLSFSYYDKVQTGELMSRLTSDVETVRMLLGRGLINFTVNILLLTAIIIMLFSLDWQLSLVAVAVFPFAYLTIRRFGQEAKPAYRVLQAQIARLTSFLQENISGIRVVKAFGQEQAEIVRFTRQNQENFARSIASSRIYAFYFPLINLLSGLGMAAVLGVGGSKVASGQMTLGTLVAFNTYLAMLLGPIRMFGWILNMLQRAQASSERIFEVLDAEIEIQDLPGVLDLKDCRGEVEFQGVSFCHLPERPVLRDISFVAKPGQMIAVVGPTGSGKSTLVNLIPRFYEPDSGVVKIDGRDSRDYNLLSLRHNIGLVMQDTFLFSAGIGQNIAYGRPDISLAEIQAGAGAAAVNDFFESLPAGYDTQIGERGMGLSGGQKQRVALARALVLRPAILILDDTTSNVDAATEHEILQSLKSLKGQATIFVIAQRFGLVKEADMILVLDQGRIVERGGHAELLAKAGLYRQMFQMQAGFEAGENG